MERQSGTLFKHPSHLIVVIKGAGEMASGVAVRLFNANIKKILMLEVEHPLAVRRTVCFCESVHIKNQTVEGIGGVYIKNTNDIYSAWDKNQVAVMVDPQWQSIPELKPDVVIDATLAKKNLGTTINEAPLVIGLGPGFEAGKDVHCIIETLRGHDLGRIIHKGTAAPNTGIPGNIGGFSVERVLRASGDGQFETDLDIGAVVTKGQAIGNVSGKPVHAKIDGVLRGLIKPGSRVINKVKIGDIDPRGKIEYSRRVSEKARAIGGGVLEAIMGRLSPKPVSLSLALGLDRKGVISFIGGGGKTSLMFKLAHELSGQGKRVLTTTTTKIFPPTPEQSSMTLTLEGEPQLPALLSTAFENRNHITLGQRIDDSIGKLIGIEPTMVDEIWNHGTVDFILIEADGSQQKPIKASADHEPVIPQSGTHLIHVTGLDAVEMPLDEDHVHRPELLSRRLNLETGDSLTPDRIALNIHHELDKSKGNALYTFAILNKADTTDLIQKGKSLAGHLKQLRRSPIIIAAANDEPPVKWVGHRLEQIMSEDIYSRVGKLIDQKEKLVIARIVRKSGSSPRDTGTACVVTKTQLYGTIGGGLLEHKVIERSRELIQSGRSSVYPFKMTSKEIAAADMVCGGELDAYLLPVFPDNPSETAVFQSLNKGMLITRIQDNRSASESSSLFIREDGQDFGSLGEESDVQEAVGRIREKGDDIFGTGPYQFFEIPDKPYAFFVEQIGKRSTVLLFGGGHVSVCVSKLAKMVGFEVCVIDDRDTFANARRFPEADTCMVCDFDHAFDKLTIDSDTYILIITRGHLHDKRVLELSLHTNAGFIGMIGSRKKRNLIYQSLLENGFTETDLKRVASPVGIDINAQTPEEIGIAIVAQLIDKRVPQKKVRLL